MKRLRLIFALGMFAALPLVWPLPGQAQRRAPAIRRIARQARAERRLERRQLPRKWLEKLQQMTPEEQRHFLENNRRFRALPPARQAEIRARLKQWNRLTPEQKRVLIRRARILDRMSARERREIRQVILPEWRQLRPARKRVLGLKLHELQPLSDSQREKRLKAPTFMRGLSPQERNLLRQLSKLKVGPGEESR